MRAKKGTYKINKIAGIESQNKREYSNGAAISMNKVEYQNICKKYSIKCIKIKYKRHCGPYTK